MAYNETLSNAKKFQAIWEPMPYFHLRPTTNSATLVCTIPKPRIAMRGKQNVTQTFIKEHYNDLLSITPDMDDDSILAKLKELGFSVRESDAKEDEKLIQAKFINLLYSNKDALSGCGYSDVHFIASELVYSLPAGNLAEEKPDKGIADIVAESDKYILLIEIKKGAGRNSGDDKAQLEKYKKFYFDDNADKTYELLRHYPNHQIKENKPVKMIYLLREGNDNADILRFNDAGDNLIIQR